MTVKKSTLALATALAACFVGCEWTGSDESDSWSSAYDAMNFSGTYRAVTTATSLQKNDDDDDDTKTTTSKDGKFKTTSDSGVFPSGSNTAAGRTAYGNVVPGSFQVSAGGYVWSDDGNGNLVFINPNSGASNSGENTSSQSVVPKSESVGTLSSSKSQQFDLTGTDVVPLSVTVTAGTITFKDDGNGVLVASTATASGTVNYEAGAITLKFTSTAQSGQPVSVTYKYLVTDQTQVVTTSLSGSGKVQYYSGAWSVQINPAIKDNTAIIVHYSYYEENSEATAPIKPVNPGSKSGNDVTALTVSQNGQNLTITLNNGVVMSGKFTNVQQTGKVNQDTNAGYNTYNAQFQVQCDGNKMVGSLNYDLSNGYRMLNGTWTWGKSSYDVQAVGPAWLNSADQSTLSPGVITK